YLPMHTATRIAMYAIRRVRALNPTARCCAYGLYAPMNAALLRESGVERVLGGELEREMVEGAKSLGPNIREMVSTFSIPPFPKEGKDGAPSSFISLEKLQFVVPDRSDLPRLAKYAKLKLPS